MTPSPDDDLPVHTARVILPDGRVVEFHDTGPGPSRVLLAHNGMPGSGLLNPDVLASARGQDWRVISLSRPGYGASHPVPGRRVADTADDVLAVLDHLGVDRVCTWGSSAGGPHALACALLLPTRVTAVAITAAPAPPDADGLDWWEAMSLASVVLYRAARDDHALLTTMLAEEADRFGALGLAALLTPAAIAGLAPATRAGLHRKIAAAFASGIDGYRDDAIALTSPWGFDVASIMRTVLIWHGREDTTVPVGHARWLAARIPGARLDLLNGVGHLVTAGRVPRLLAALSEVGWDAETVTAD